MPFTLDPEFASAAGGILKFVTSSPKPAVHDIETRRGAFPALFAGLTANFVPPPGIEKTRYDVKATDGHSIAVYHYHYSPSAADSNTKPTPAIVHFHGGGLIMGDVDLQTPGTMTQVAATRVPVFSVEYRLAPEHKHPIPVTDGYAALRWVQEHAADFNVDPARLAVMGESAGGCIAAGVALLARDRGLPGPKLAKQILVYPMLDSENLSPDAALKDFAVWTHEDNATGWTALLDGGDTHDVGVEYASAARAKDLADLPPAYIDVGTLDIFRDEDVAYAQRLLRAGVQTELHVYAGVPHAFELLAASTGVTKAAFANRYRAIVGLAA